MDIYIKPPVWKKIINYACAANEIHGTEIAGWGHYNQKKGIYKLAPLTKQEVKGAEVDSFPDELLKQSDYVISDMSVQWHSHVNMRAFFSSTDIANIKNNMKLMELLVSLVVNVREEYACRVDFAYYTPFGVRKVETIDNINVIVGNNTKIPEDILEEVRTKCTKYTPPQIISATQIGFGYGREFGYGRDWTNPYFPDIVNDKKKVDKKTEEKTAETIPDQVSFLPEEVEYPLLSPSELHSLILKINVLIEQNPSKMEIVDYYNDGKSEYLFAQFFDGRIMTIEDNGINIANFSYTNYVKFIDALKTLYGSQLIYN